MTTYNLSYDVVVYGGYSGNGMAEAIWATRLSTIDRTVSVALVCEGSWVGGMLVNSLPKSDIGAPLLVRRGSYYDLFIEATGEAYGRTIQYSYEPHVAQSIVLRALANAGVRVFTDCPVNRPGGIVMNGAPAITTLTATHGSDTYVFSATQFIDAAHEGDVMQLALAEGTGWMVGREPSTQYGEAGAGFNRSPVYKNFNPYVTPGVLYDQIRVAPSLAVGAADSAIQNAAYRITLSNQSGNTVSWASSSMIPPGYSSTNYALEGLLRPVTDDFEPGGDAPGIFTMNDNVILLNTDASIGTVGVPLHWFYPKATYAQRRTIETTIENWLRGKYHFFATDPSRVGEYQNDMQQYGLARSEFTANGFWPIQLYFREGARLIGQYVCTQQNTQNTNPALGRSTTQAASITPAGYSLDIHEDQYITDGASTARFNQEGSGAGGNSQVDDDGWAVPWASLLPDVAQCTNLQVTYCSSMSHVAWGSYRILWQNYCAGAAAGIAAGYCIVNNIPLSALPVATLRGILRDTYDFIIDPIRQKSTHYYVGARRQNGSNTYICMQEGITGTGGGPTGTGTSIVDGGVIWAYTVT